MTEETAKFGRDARAAASTQEQLRQARQTLTELRDLLRQQQADLRHKGMTLPARTMEHLDAASKRLERLNEEVVTKQIQLRQLRALAQTTALINSTLDTDSVLNQVMDTVIQLTGAERGYIMLRNQTTQMMEFRVARGIDREQLNRDDFQVSNTIVNEVASTGLPVLTDNARNDPRYENNESIINLQLRSILAVPLKTGAQVIGVVYCDNRVVINLFRAHEKSLLEAFANQAAVAIQNARLFEVARAQLAEITSMRDLMNNMFTSVASGLVTLDIDDNITGWNRAAEQIAGISEADAVGKPLCVVLPDMTDQTDHIQRVREAGAQEAIELELNLNGSGRRFWSIVMSPLRGYAGSVVLVLDDLTEQREREAQLKQIRNYLPGVLVENIRNTDILNLSGQEREITVLSADVRGFSTFSEQLQPEQLMEIINKYLAVASDSIDLQEGVVDKYLGDAVIGLFNTQLNPQEDHALRAVRAAMIMVRDVTAIHETLPPEQRLFYGVGIHTGVAVLGNVGGADRREFATLGEAAEMSKLLQENAGRGEIMLSASTYALVSENFECEAMPPRKTKEGADLEVIYRLVGRKRKTSTLTTTVS
jgi:PAS domain S-box-containing protein